jgi:hypothetical protein
MYNLKKKFKMQKSDVFCFLNSTNKYKLSLRNFLKLYSSINKVVI